MKFIPQTNAGTRVKADDFPLIFRLGNLAIAGYRQVKVSSSEIGGLQRMLNTGYLDKVNVVGNRASFRFEARYYNTLVENNKAGSHLRAKLMLEKMNRERKSLARLEADNEMPASIKSLDKPRADDGPKAKAVATPRPVGSNIESCLKELREATDPSTKRKLRAKLRKMGHKGGARG